MSRHDRGLRGRTDGQRSGAAGGEGRPAADQNIGLGQRQTSQNRMSHQGRGLQGWMDRQAGTGNPATERRDGL